MKKYLLFLGGVMILGWAGCYGTERITVSNAPARFVAGDVPEDASATDVSLKVGPHEDLDAVLWMQTSAEYIATARQVYRMAEAGLQGALDDPTWSADVEQQQQEDALPETPAVILDLDETVLDNSAFQARLITRDEEFTTEVWNQWVEESRAELIPGADSFVQACRDLGVEVFFVTNRDCKVEWATRDNLEQHGILEVNAPDTILSKNERANWDSDKKTRRAFVALRYRILMVIGDDLNDFISIPDSRPAARRALADDQATFWGSRWFLIPNATYGGWDRALYGSEHELPRSQKLSRKRAHLKMSESKQGPLPSPESMPATEMEQRSGQSTLKIRLR